MSDNYPLHAHVELAPTANVGYIYLTKIGSGGVTRTAIWDEEGINIDYDAEGRIVGIEIMDCSKAPPK